MGRGKRFNGTEPKLNVKKVVAVIIAILVVAMLIAVIAMLTKPSKSVTEKKAALAYYTIFENEKWGVINSSGDTIITPSYDEMITIPNKEKAVFIVTYSVDYENGTYKSKAINEKGEDLFTTYDQVEAVQNYDEQNNIWYETNCLKVKKDKKIGLIDLSGKMLLNCDYEDITPIQGVSNSLITTKDGKKGLASTTGTVVIENSYSRITTLTSQYENGYIVKNDDDKFGVIGTNKKILLPIEYDDIKHVYSDSTYVAKKDGEWKVINTVASTENIISYENATSIDNGYIIVQNSDKFGLINSNGEETIAPQYESLIYIFENYYIAKKYSKYGIVNVNNETKIDFMYNYLTYIKAADIIEADTGKAETDLLDRNFNLKLTGIVSEINVTKGYLKIRTDADYKYYNFKFEEKKSSDILTTNTLFLDKKDGKYGYVDKNGVVVINYIYDDATEQNAAGFVAVKKDGKWGTINSKGQTVVEPKYTLDNNTIIDFIGTWHMSEDINAGYYTK